MERQVGAVMVEYVVIVAVVAVGAIGGLSLMGSKLHHLLSSSSGSVGTVSKNGKSGDLDGRPTTGSVSISCTGTGCSTLTAALSGWDGATSYTYAWQRSDGGCAGSQGWSDVGSDSPTVDATSSGGYRVVVTASNSSGDSAPATACSDT